MVHLELNGRLPSGVSRTLIQGLVEAAYGSAGSGKSALVTISLVGDAEIRKLNRRYRGKDCVTDVLSFGYDGAAKGDMSLGDVVICLPQVKRQAKRAGKLVREEFALMVVHGMLHLLGYDHVTLAEERAMFGLQHDILIRTGIL
jgi:probable rRNA maturation factor